MSVNAETLLAALALSAQKPLIPSTGPGPQKVSVRHNEIMDFLLCNPNVRLQDVALQFQMTPGWLSQVIHSDAFQSLLREKKGYAFHHTVLSVREKMENIAHKALDKLDESLNDEKDASALVGVAGDMLDRLGFGTNKGNASPGAVTQNNYYTVLATELRSAQALMYKRPQAALEIGLGTEPVAIQNANASLVGETDFAAPLQLASSEGNEGSAGNQVRGEGP